MDLQALSFVEALRKNIREDMNNYTDDLANGQCASFEVYRELCGVIRGLALAERHLLDLAQLMEEKNDE
jgi:hypothetical protein